MAFVREFCDITGLFAKFSPILGWAVESYLASVGDAIRILASSYTEDLLNRL